jgi:hypothetical protein
MVRVVGGGGMLGRGKNGVTFWGGVSVVVAGRTVVVKDRMFAREERGCCHTVVACSEL